MDTNIIYYEGPNTATPIAATIWSPAPGGAYWVIPKDPPRRFIKVRRRNHRYVLCKP